MSHPNSTRLRDRKKAQTQQRLQEHALRLILAHGYEATTVEAIAAAAEVSPVTFYRYFPTKEHAVLADDYDPMIAELIAARPAHEPVTDSLRHALAVGLGRVYATDHDRLLTRTQLIMRTPALRARLWEQQNGTEQLICEALKRRAGADADPFALRVATATCLAAITTAVKIWAERPDKAELPDLIDQAFDMLLSEVR